MSVQFQIHRDHATTKTPRRNENIEHALEFMERLCCWSRDVQMYFYEHLDKNLRHKHSSAGTSRPPFTTAPDLQTISSKRALFCPLLVPLFEDKTTTAKGEGLTLQEEAKESGSSSSVCHDDNPLSRLTSSEFGSSTSWPSLFLSSQDMHKLLNEQIRTIHEATKELHKMYPSKEDETKLISVAEAMVVFVVQTSGNFGDTV
jgi:predicted translin family RNA/ssDNA-binding protein